MGQAVALYTLVRLPLVILLRVRHRYHNNIYLLHTIKDNKIYLTQIYFNYLGGSYYNFINKLTVKSINANYSINIHEVKVSIKFNLD